MNDSAASPHAVLRYLFTGVTAVLCTAVAMGSWLSLAFAHATAPGAPASAARQRRGRAS